MIDMLFLPEISSPKYTKNDKKIFLIRDKKEQFLLRFEGHV